MSVLALRKRLEDEIENILTAISSWTKPFIQFSKNISCGGHAFDVIRRKISKTKLAIS